MQRNQFIFFFLFFLPLFSWSQTLSGIVYDEHNQTVPGASVYLDGTSIGTVTDENGQYSLAVKNKINTLLIISFLGYESAMVEQPFEKPAQKIHLIPKENALKEVVVVAQPFSRKSMLKIFRKQFLGTTKAGKSCEILNEDAISLHYDKATNQLTARADAPLLIKNSFLGYDIAFNLIQFTLGFYKHSIASDQVASSFFSGTALYKEMPDSKKMFINRRKKIYLGSQMHFFRNLSRNIWGKSEFELFNGSYPANPNEIFSISINDGTHTIAIKDAKNPKHFSLSDGFNKTLNLLYNRSKQSRVVFKTPTFAIDDYGNIDAIEHIFFSGEMGKYRFGNLLPLDFHL